MISCPKCSREFPGAKDGCDLCRPLVEHEAKQVATIRALKQFVGETEIILNFDEGDPVDELRDALSRLYNTPQMKEGK